MNNICLIHNNNIGYEDYFNKAIKFSLGSIDIDKYISEKIIPKIKDKNYNIIYIKDNLSSNYLELYGLRVAYHIRLSSELSFEERCLPIVIISDVGINILNRLSKISNILYTKNIFIIKNNLNAIESFDTKKISSFKSQNDYKENFLDCIDIKPPKESSHDIANEWAIFKWAKELEISDSDTINNTISSISYQLYFKYLLQKTDNHESINTQNKKQNIIQRKSGLRIVKIKDDIPKKVLIIDDELDKGWGDIFVKYFKQKKKYAEPEILPIELKNKKYEDIEPIILKYIENYKPDLIILDMRLIESDHSENNPENISGIKLLNEIKKKSLDTQLNPGIQVIMLSATTRSDILEQAMKDNKIVGYIQKDHINSSITTKENIQKLTNLIKESEEKFFLKDIWDMQKNILKLDIFKTKKYNEIKIEVEQVFDILDSNIEHPNNFVVFIFTRCLEFISKLYINEYDAKYLADDREDIGVYNYYDNTIHDIGNEKWYKNTQNRLHNIMYKKLDLRDRIMHENLCTLINCRNFLSHPNEKRPHGCKLIKKPDNNNILTWFKLLEKIIIKIK